jgi:hypothetical protein
MEAQAIWRYAACAVNEMGDLTIGGDGMILLSATGLRLALHKASHEGWKLHSVECTGVESYLVILEK